jgi:hypothetical protein
MLNDTGIHFFTVKYATGREVNQPQHWFKYVEKIFEIHFMNPFTVADEVTWGLRKLSQGWRHITLRNHF